MIRFANSYTLLNKYGSLKSSLKFYSQCGILYDIILNAPRSKFDPKFKLGLHADGIFISTSDKPIESVTNKMNNLSIKQPALGQFATSSHPTQMMDVLLVKSSSPKGNQQLGRNKNKGKNNWKGGNKNDNDNNDKNMNNGWGDKKPKRKVKFPCKLCKDDHLTHLCPQMEYALNFIA